MNLAHKCVMNCDTAVVITAHLSLDDIFNCRLVCAQWRGIFKIPPLVWFTDHVGDAIGARRHNYTFQTFGNFVILDKRNGNCYSFESRVFNNTLFTGVPIKGFPIILLRSWWRNQIDMLNATFGTLTDHLPIFWAHDCGKTGDITRAGLVDYSICVSSNCISRNDPGCVGYRHINYARKQQHKNEFTADFYHGRAPAGHFGPNCGIAVARAAVIICLQGHPGRHARIIQVGH